MKRKKNQAQKPDLEELELSKETDGLSETEDLVGNDLVDEEILEHELTHEEQIEALLATINDMTVKAEEYLDGWQRSRAEFANYKKRILKENTEIHKAARGEVIRVYLDIVDDLERALGERPATEDGEAWADGIEIIYQKLRSRLEAEGVKPMNPLGEDFDPNIHEALMKEDNDEYESGKIIEVLQEGYWIGDKVLRPAQVRVAA